MYLCETNRVCLNWEFDFWRILIALTQKFSTDDFVGGINVKAMWLIKHLIFQRWQSFFLTINIRLSRFETKF